MTESMTRGLSGWKLRCDAMFQEFLPNDPPSAGVPAMVESCAELIKERIGAYNEIFSRLQQLSVRCASAAELASHLFDAWSAEIGTAFLSANNPQPGRTPTAVSDDKLAEIASGMYGTLIGRLAEWSVGQFELMLPQSRQNELIVPWGAIIDLSAGAHCDPGRMTCFILIESITSSVLLNDERYAAPCLELWSQALEFDSIDLEMLLGRSFESDLREPGPASPDNSPHRVKDPKALVDAFSSSRRAAAIASLGALSAEAFASVKVITKRVASGLFGVEAFHLEHVLDQYRIDVPDFAHLLQAGIGTSVCSNPWTKSLAKYELALEVDGISGVVDSLHATAARCGRDNLLPEDGLGPSHSDHGR